MSTLVPVFLKGYCAEIFFTHNQLLRLVPMFNGGMLFKSREKSVSALSMIPWKPKQPIFSAKRYVLEIFTY
jgi:hypothetical protein